MHTRFFSLLVALLLAGGLSAQYSTHSGGPYHLSWEREAGYSGLALVTNAAGVYFQNQDPELTLNDLGLRGFRGGTLVDEAYGNLVVRDQARLLSDKMLNFNAALPLALVLGKRTRRDIGKIAVLYAETMLIAGGVTSLTKATFLRPRPYVVAPGFDRERPLESGDRASFISGHTSMSAAGTFFFARVFADYYPDSKLKPVVWVAAATLPAFTGYLRVRAAKHFPTDIMAGYAVGAAIGYLVPTLHKRAVLPRGMSLSGGMNGMYLAYRF